MLDLTALDLDEIATALADQLDYEHHWLINSQTGQILFWTRDCGIDGHHPVDLDDLDPDLVVIGPLPSNVWYQDMADFAEQISDEHAGRRLARAIQYRDAFRRFKDDCTRSTPSCYRRGTPSATCAPYAVAGVPAAHRDLWRRCNDRDVRAAVSVLARFGALRLDGSPDAYVAALTPLGRAALPACW